MNKVARFIVGLMMVVILVIVLISSVTVRDNDDTLFLQQSNVTTYTPTQFDNVFITAAP